MPLGSPSRLVHNGHHTRTLVQERQTVSVFIWCGGLSVAFEDVNAELWSLYFPLRVPVYAVMCVEGVRWREYVLQLTATNVPRMFVDCCA